MSCVIACMLNEVKAMTNLSSDKMCFADRTVMCNQKIFLKTC